MQFESYIYYNKNGMHKSMSHMRIETYKILIINNFLRELAIVEYYSF